LNKKCDKALLQCDLNCGGKVSKKDLQSHKELDCPNFKIACYFKDLGCKHKSVRKYAHKHLIASIQIHLKLVTISKTRPRRNTEYKAVPDSSRFENYKLLPDESGFTISSADCIYRFDEHGGWYDEYAFYYDTDGDYCDPPEIEDEQEYDEERLYNKLMKC